MVIPGSQIPDIFAIRVSPMSIYRATVTYCAWRELGNDRG